MLPGLNPEQFIQNLSNPPIGDEILVDRARQSPHLFTELYHRYKQRVYSYHLSRTGSSMDAEELTSQTFLAALENLNHFDEKRNFAGWLFGIAHHKLTDYLRKGYRDLPLETSENTPAPDPTPEEQTSRKADLSEIAKALKKLPSDQVDALSLRIFGQLSAAQAGKVMGKSEAAVKMLVFRAIRSLQQMLVHPLEVL
jgi:RNA polymerase sigma-70 factor, ECF subfamily